MKNFKTIFEAVDETDNLDDDIFDDDDLFEEILDFVFGIDPDVLSDEQAEILDSIIEKIEQYEDEDDCPEGQHICPETGECVPIGSGKEDIDEAAPARKARRDKKKQREGRRKRKKGKVARKLKAKKYRKSSKGRQMAKKRKRMAKRGKTATGKRIRKFIN